MSPLVNSDVICLSIVTLYAFL